jgi:hypothetical protein
MSLFLAVKSTAPLMLSTNRPGTRPYKLRPTADAGDNTGQVHDAIGLRPRQIGIAIMRRHITSHWSQTLRPHDHGMVRLWSLIMAVAFASVGCNDAHITDAVMVANRTNETLHFDIVLADGNRFALNTSAMPGETVRLLDGSQLSDGAGMMRDRCTVGEIRALGPDGHTVSRVAPPVCAPTTVVIGPAASAT